MLNPCCVIELDASLFYKLLVENKVRSAKIEWINTSVERFKMNRRIYFKNFNEQAFRDSGV